MGARERPENPRSARTIGPPLKPKIKEEILMTTKTVTIKRCDEDDPFELYCAYDGQEQDCMIELDLETGVLDASYDPEIGNAVPMYVWDGIVRRYRIPCLSSQGANRAMEAILPLAQRVLDGAEVVWDPVHAENRAVFLTDEGMRRLRSAAPDHVESVRRVVFDHMTPEQHTHLKAFMEQVIAVTNVPGHPEYCGPLGADC